MRKISINEILPEPQNSGSMTAPDTTGMNFFQADSSLKDLLGIYLDLELYHHLHPHLERFGHLVANELDEWGRIADRNPPVLHHRDRFGRDVQHVEYHPAYREIERIAFGEFGMHAMPHRSGILGWKGIYPAVAKHAFTYLFNQAEYGMGCPINVSEVSIMMLRRYGTKELQERYLDRMTTQDMSQLLQGAQFMTEKEGGSDVGLATTEAIRDGSYWRLYGEKWFCSNADAGISILLARPQGAGPGTRGLGLFLMPRFLEDGSPNHYRIVRLKDKLGSRSMASGEIKFEGAIAYQLGELNRGFKNMTDMVNHSRLSNGVKSAALMRRAMHDAWRVAHNRVAFGKILIHHPLAQRQLLKMMLAVEEALSIYMFTADTLDRAEGNSKVSTTPAQDAAALLRILTPVLKFRATRDARKVAGDSLEMRGGSGYIEEFVNPRLVRDAHLGSVWEGAGNVISLDVITRAIGKQNAQEILAAELHSRLDECGSVPESFRDRLGLLVDRAIAFASEVAASPELESQSRQVTSTLYHVTAATVMTWEACRIAEQRGDARRLILAKLVVDHHLTPQDPMRGGDTRDESRIASLLLSDTVVPMAVATELVSG